MKKRSIILVALLGLFILGSLWWLLPVKFLNHVESEKVMKIEVFNGNNGNDFVIEDRDQINKIVSNIQNVSMKKQKISIGYMGTLYHLNFLDSKGKTIEVFTLNDKATIRKDPFFYHDTTNTLCVDLLSTIENTLSE